MMHTLLVYFQGDLQFYIIIFLLFGLLVKGNEIESNVIIYLPRAVFLWAYFMKFTNPCMYVFSTRKYFEPLLCTLTHRIILFNSGLQKFCNPAIPE